MTKTDQIPNNIGADKPKLKPISLRFTGKDANLERYYYDDYYKKSLIPIRLALLFAIAFYSMFSVLDVIYAPEVWKQVWIIRFAIVAPVLLLIIGLTFTPIFQKTMQLLMSLGALIAGSGVLAMMVITPAPRGSTIYTGLILVMIYLYTIIRLRFVWASITGWLLVIAYEIVGIRIIDTPNVVLISNSFFCIGANFIGMLACYFIEYHFRLEYFLTKRDELHRTKIESMNTKLTITVEELRAALDNIKVLKGLIPICSNCKKIRDDKGFWHRVEQYITEHSDAVFSHGICPYCFSELYPDLDDEEFDKYNSEV